MIYDMIWYDIWYDIWYMIWYDMIYDMIYIYIYIVYMRTFLNTLSIPSSMEQTGWSETLAYKNWDAGELPRRKHKIIYCSKSDRQKPHHNNHHHHHISVMQFGHLLTRSSLTYPEVSSKVCHNSFCQLGNSVSLPWVIYYQAFYLHLISSFYCIPVICPKLVLFLIPL